MGKTVLVVWSEEGWEAMVLLMARMATVHRPRMGTAGMELESGIDLHGVGSVVLWLLAAIGHECAYVHSLYQLICLLQHLSSFLCFSQLLRSYEIIYLPPALACEKIYRLKAMQLTLQNTSHAVHDGGYVPAVFSQV